MAWFSWEGELHRRRVLDRLPPWGVLDARQCSSVVLRPQHVTQYSEPEPSLHFLSCVGKDFYY